MRPQVRRLALVSDAPQFGGAERYILAMAAAAQRRGIAACVWWLPPRGTCESAFDGPTSSGVEIMAAEASQLRSALGLRRAFRAMLDAWRPDALIVNASGRPQIWLVPWLARRAGLPAAWVHHMVDSRDHRRLPPSRLSGRLEGLHLWRVPQALRHGVAAAGAAAVIASNPQDRDWLLRWQRVPRQKLHVIPPGIDCARFCPDSRELAARREEGLAGRFVIGTAARLVAGKGVDQLIEAGGLLRARGMPVELVIAGTGPERAALAALAAARGLGERVRFIEFVEDMPAFYRELDAFVLASDTESFGLALAEAMACERAVVATPTAGPTLLIEHPRTGWLLNSYAPAELAEALEQLYRDPLRRRDMGLAARQSVVRRFNIEVTLARTLELLERPAGSMAWADGRELAGLAAEEPA